MLFIFDTETTGLPNNRLPLDHPEQPDIVSIGYIARYEGYTVEYHTLIKPNGWLIDEEGPAFRAHKITNQMCRDDGIELSLALAEFQEEVEWAQEIGGYNIEFDIKLLAIAYAKLNLPFLFPNVPRIDVMELARDRCHMPPTPAMLKAGFNKYKNPKLSEAVEILLQKPFPGAHNALDDCRATLEILDFMRKKSSRRSVISHSQEDSE